MPAKTTISFESIQAYSQDGMEVIDVAGEKYLKLKLDSTLLIDAQGNIKANSANIIAEAAEVITEITPGVKTWILSTVSGVIKTPNTTMLYGVLNVNWMLEDGDIIFSIPAWFAPSRAITLLAASSMGPIMLSVNSTGNVWFKSNGVMAQLFLEVNELIHLDGLYFVKI